MPPHEQYEQVLGNALEDGFVVAVRHGLDTGLLAAKFDADRDPGPHQEHTLMISVRDTALAVIADGIPHDWISTGTGFIDVRFMLLKGTYEERIFHTVMQRDQWFQILIGSKRRELGEIKAGEEVDAEAVTVEPEAEEIEDVLERGRLTPEEKLAVMLDLRPSPLTQG